MKKDSFILTFSMIIFYSNISYALIDSIELKEVQSLIPKGWELSVNTRNWIKDDFNNDGILDISLAIGKPLSEKNKKYSNYTQTKLLIYLGKKSKDYYLDTENTNVIPNKPQIWNGMYIEDSSYFDMSANKELCINTHLGGMGNAIELSSKSLIFIVLSCTEYKTYVYPLTSFSVQNADLDV